MKIFITTMKSTVCDLKDSWKMFREAPSKKEKAKYFPLVYFNAFYLLLYSVLIGTALINIVLSFIYGYYGLIVVLFILPVLTIFIIIRRKVYPKFKDYYLNGVPKDK